MERLSYESISGEVRNHAEAAFVAKLPPFQMTLVYCTLFEWS